jgi:hypothetical protein
MTTLNLARFKINGTPSEDSNGKRGYDATASQVLTCTLERTPATGVLTVTYQVFDPADPTSPLASKDATQQLWDGNSQPSITDDSVNDDFDLTVNAATILDSFVIRCTAVTATGAHIWERMVSVRQSGLRMTTPTETQQYAQRGWSDAMNELTEFVATGGLGLTPPADPGDDGKVAVAQSGDLTYVFIDDHHIANAAGIDITKLDYSGASPGDVMVIGGGGTPVWGSVSGGMTPPSGGGDDGKVAFASTASPGDLDYADQVKIINPGGSQNGFAFGTDPASSGILRFSALPIFAGRFGATPADVEFIQCTVDTMKIGGTGGGSVLANVEIWTAATRRMLIDSTMTKLFVATLQFANTVTPVITQEEATGTAPVFTIQAGSTQNASSLGANLRLRAGRSYHATTPGSAGNVVIEAAESGASTWTPVITCGVASTGVWKPWVGLGFDYANDGILRLPVHAFICAGDANAFSLIGMDNLVPRVRVGDPGKQGDFISSTSYVRILDTFDNPTGEKHLRAGPDLVMTYLSAANFDVGFAATNPTATATPALRIWGCGGYAGGGNYQGGDVLITTGAPGGTESPGSFSVFFGNEANRRIGMDGYSPSFYIYDTVAPTSKFAKITPYEIGLSATSTSPDQIAIFGFGATAGDDAVQFLIRGMSPGAGASNPDGGRIVITGGGPNSGGRGGFVILRNTANWNAALTLNKSQEFAIESADNAGPASCRTYLTNKLHNYTSVGTSEVVAWSLPKADLLPVDDLNPAPNISIVAFLRWTILAYTGDGATSTGVYWRQAALKIQDSGVVQVWNHPVEMTPSAKGAPLQTTDPYLTWDSPNLEFRIQPSTSGADYQILLEVKAFYAP